MAKKRTNALFEAMSKSKSLRPPASPRMSAARGTASPATPDAGGSPSSDESGRAFETPEWMQKNSAPSTAAQRAANVGRDGGSVESDPDRQEVKFRLSYTTIGIIAFGVIATVVLAVIVGREWSNRQTVNTETTEGLLAGPAKPEVLDTKPGQGGMVEPDDNRNAAPIPVTPVAPPNPGGTGVSPLPPAPLPSPVVDGRASRVKGLNYIVVQSYPEEAVAKSVVDLLKRNAIDATIEQGLQGLPAKWSIVVTATGYPRGSPETDTLRKKIEQVSTEQSRKDRKWKAFEPLVYRWR